LVGVHYLVPEAIEAQLTFDHAHPVPWASVTAGYVHHSTQHLVSNLVGFCLGGGVVYALCRLQNRRRWFVSTTLLFLVFLPALVTATSFWAFHSLGVAPTSRGFSGVVAGYVGFIIVAVSRFVGTRSEQRVGVHVGTAIWIVLLTELLVIYEGVPSVLQVTLVGVGLTLTLGGVIVRGSRQEWSKASRRRVAIQTGFVTLVVAFLVMFVVVLFPHQIVRDGVTTNIVGHAAGVVWGMVLAIVGMGCERALDRE
jgi:hypothetical protein